jgi:hypothetical protein
MIKAGQKIYGIKILPMRAGGKIFPGETFQHYGTLFT